ncbi:phage tail protein I [Sphingomonas sp. Mn802worker]|uniref:phage tail protein I n=1 Tax=Sphingomonas sp. Mn802worker TaxID=629773 RepID=UPI00036713FC|nr:phage tail protein I [Sphingomonas sp. Mn802worker]
MTTSLLPPNSTPLERALEQGVRILAVDTPVDAIDDPLACPAELLPWLAWGASVDIWDADWPEAEKRSVVATSLADHRLKGTRLSVETVLARFDALAYVVEWFEAELPRPPHTFDIMLPIVTRDGVAPGGFRATAAFADAIIREVSRVKPLREHLQLVQAVLLGAPIAPVAAARAAEFTRADVALTIDTDPVWQRLLQTEDGEPLEDDTGDYLEDA